LSPNDTRARVREFVARSLGSMNLEDGDDIFRVGGATSLFAMELVMFIEKQFGIVLEDNDLERANFATIDALTALVDRKLAGSKGDSR
jgi:methoxymalonate biosynthesis acyl carrier protein